MLRNARRNGRVSDQHAWGRASPGHRAAHPWRALVLATLVALLAACSSAPPAPPQPAPERVTPEQSMARGDYVEAAEAWQKLALAADPQQAAGLMLNAAEAWLLADRPDPAIDALRWIERDLLTVPDQARLKLALADLSLRADRPEEAEELLLQADSDLPARYRSRYEQLREAALQVLARPGARDFSDIIALSRASDQYQPAEALALLQALENVPSGELALRAQNPRADRTLTGWLDLALVIRTNLVDGGGLIPAMAAWKARHPYHYLAEADGLDLWLLYRDQFMPPAKVAVLLPETGRLRDAAEAIRDGIVSAYLDAPDGAEIIFIDSGEEPESAPAAYFEARDQGADWIIGPLQKPSIEALLSLASLTTPMLALNELPADGAEDAGVLPRMPAGLSGQIYSLALSQEAEVRVLARAAAEAGLRRAILLAPESAWGERMARQFSDAFLQENGQILASVRYLESENDHSADLERVLMIDQSKARRQRLENVLQMPLEFEPIRRDDVDMIFLAANPVQGRQIRPQLRFHGAGDVPVYASGRIYSGRPDPTRDQDLNGVRFPLTPMELESLARPGQSELDSLRGGALLALHALGRDGWNILPWLELMKRDRDFRFHGASGTWRSSAWGGNLFREPQLAVFRAGKPVPLGAGE